VFLEMWFGLRLITTCVVVNSSIGQVLYFTPFFVILLMTSWMHCWLCLTHVLWSMLLRQL